MGLVGDREEWNFGIFKGIVSWKELCIRINALKEREGYF
jgi:hypothetical protein